jgi:hypothetical protein
MEMALSSQKLSYKGQFIHICQLNVSCGQDSVSGIVPFETPYFQI